MQYCPSCGAPVEKGAAACSHCGSPLRQENPPRGSTDRGLRLAITVVASLWVITAGLWLLWPRLTHAVPSDPSAAQGVLSGGLNQPQAVSAAPTGAPDPVPSAEAPSVQQPSPSITAPASPAPASPTPSSAKAVEKLELFSWWWGYLFLDDFQGENPYEKDVIQVWGYIGYTTDDRAFFEIYDQREVTDETIPLVSYYVDLHEDYLVPVIGKRDAWVLDRYLDQSDTAPLTLHLVDGNLKLSYHYEFESQSCDLFCMLVPED